MARGFGAALSLTAAGIWMMACTGIVDPSKNVVETLSGTVQVQGSASNEFSTSKNGEFSIKVTSLTPATTSFFGVIYSIRPGGGSCAGSQLLENNGFATVNTTALSGAIYPGDYCVFIYDIGSFTTAEDYTVQVSHP